MLIFMSKAKPSVIFLRGLGDHRPMTQGQSFLAGLWRLYGIELVQVRIGWSDAEPFEAKLERIIKLIDKLHGQGRPVSLLGISAGASAALNAYTARPDKIDKVVFVCGKFHNPKPVNPRYFLKNPAFKVSLELADQNLPKLTAADKAKILSIHPVYDELIRVSDMIIPGAHNKTILSAGHIPSIFLGLTIYSSIAARFIKSNARAVE